MDFKDIQQRIRDTALEAYEEKLFAGTSGNLSEYCSKEGVMAITPSSVDYRVLQPEQIVLMRLDGEILAGALEPSSEWRMHAYVYQKREDAKAILHTHSPYATGFAVAGEGIPIILIEMVPFLGGEVPLAPFALPGTESVGVEAVEAMGGKKSCLLANHGVLAVGGTLEAAHLSAVYVEDAAKIYYYSRQLGSPRLVPADAVAAMKKRYGVP